MNEPLRTFVWLLVLLAGIGATMVQLGSHDDASRTDLAGTARDAGHGNSAIREPGKPSGPALLFDWDVPDVASLQLTGASSSRRFIASAQGWREVDMDDTPIDAGGAPAFDAEAYLSLFSQARADRSLPGTEEDTDDSYGLATPLLRITVTGHEAKLLARLAVGARTPDGYGRYVRLASRNAVLIVPDYQFREAIKATGGEAAP